MYAIYIYICLNGGVQPLQPGDDDEIYIYLYRMFFIYYTYKNTYNII